MATRSPQEIRGSIERTRRDLAVSVDDMRTKFDALVMPVLGARGETLFALARDFGRAGTLAEMHAILARL